MVKCSACKEEKARASFSKAQLRRPDATRRCKVCAKNQRQPLPAEDGTAEGIGSVATSSAQSTVQSMLQGALQAQLQDERGGDKREHPSQQRAIQEAFYRHEPPDVIPLSAANKNTVLDMIKIAVEKIMQRGLPPGVGIEDAAGLVGRLWDVLNNENTLWLTWPLLLGLGSDDKRKINSRFPPNRPANAEPLPLIHWLCQYKLYHATESYQGGDDMIALAIDAGANLKLKNSNGTTCLSFAVKYTSQFAVDLLISSGARVGNKDVFGNSIWKNTVERPDPGIIDVILRRCNDAIPVKDERLLLGRVGDSSFKFEVFQSVADHMIGVYSGSHVTTEDINCSIPVSWRALGVPSNEAIGTALIRVLQGGAEFTDYIQTGQKDSFAIVTYIDSLEWHHPVQQQIDIIRSMRDVIYGRWLPAVIREEIHETNPPDPDFAETSSPCPICLTEMSTVDHPITLYCGHTFCLGCALAYGKAPRLNEDQPLTGRALIHPIDGHLMIFDQTGDKRCPCCRRLFPGEFLTLDWNAQYRTPRMRFGIDRHEANEDIRGLHGPHTLTDEQLRFECRTIGTKFTGAREELLSDLKRVMSREFGHTEYTDGSGTLRKLSIDSDMRMELSATSSLIGGGENPLFLGHPMRGHAVIRIQIKGIPVMATLSHNSVFTIVPQCVADSFEMKTKPITSTQFTDVMGKSVSVAAVVDEFKFLLDGVEICLTSAIVLEDKKDFNMSIQLGMDFFQSAAWTRSSTAFGENLSVIFDGGHTKNNFLKDQPNELRYYSRDGKIARAPFVHVSHLSDTHKLPIVSLPGDLSTNFAECQWCTRMFPNDGMVEDKDRQLLFNRFYCDEECKSRGLAVRTNTPGHN
ncbi:hypothetical protein ACHAXR_011139 [Thalassiosira sp. AJA248-18]